MKLKLRIPRQETRREEALRRAADAAAATPTPREVRYRIQEADNLGYIAGRFYGNRDLWRRVYDANTDILENPDRLPVGLELRIPDPVAPR
jgi:nucleoid-associated protein YgaU